MTKRKKNVFDIQYSWEYCVAFVWVEAENITGYFSQNGFTVYGLVGSYHSLTFYSMDDHVTTQTLQDSLKVTTVTDILQA